MKTILVKNMMLLAILGTIVKKQLEWSHSRQLDKFADIAEFTYNASGV